MYDYEWLCMTMTTMYNYVWLGWLGLTRYDYVWLGWLGLTRYDYVWLCLTLYGSIWFYPTVYMYELVKLY